MAVAISVANSGLVYLGPQVVLASMETWRQSWRPTLK
jgi:hypothetical protein